MLEFDGTQGTSTQVDVTCSVSGPEISKTPLLFKSEGCVSFRLGVVDQKRTNRRKQKICESCYFYVESKSYV